MTPAAQPKSRQDVKADRTVRESHAADTTSPGRRRTIDVGEPFDTRFVISRDGTAVRYLQLGRGPGIVLLHGAMESARSHAGLARALADTFTHRMGLEEASKAYELFDSRADGVLKILLTPNP